MKHKYVWYSICSIHQQLDEQCNICHSGTWVDENSAEFVADQKLWKSDPNAWRIKANERERDTVTITWSVEDVEGLEPSFTKDQCREVLQAFDKHHEGSMESMWVDLQYHIDNLKELQRA